MLFLLVSPLHGLGKSAPKIVKENVIDNFEEGKEKINSDWWTFGNISLQTVSGKDLRYALQIKGAAHDWYVGGIGKYIGKDASKYSSLDMDVFGSGRESGILKIELYDDDNGNWQIEQDPKKGYAPIYDDRFVYQLKIDWNGFKHVSIPFSEFVDNNPNEGDNIWDPQQSNGSGGLIQMQFIVNAASKTGRVDIAIDNIELE